MTPAVAGDIRPGASSLRDAALAVCAVIGAVAGCSDDARPTPDEEPSTVGQALGESSTAYWFAGNGAGAMPTYDERVVWHLINQVRMNTEAYDIRDMDGNLIPSSPPLVYQAGMAEAGRWEGAHALEYTCYCPQDPMMEPAAWNSCCQAGYVDGTVRCVGPIVTCDDPQSMEQVDRWGLLNRGPGEIRSSAYWATDDDAAASGLEAANWFFGSALILALGPRDAAGAAALATIPLVPEECLAPDDASTCDNGDCLGPNGEESCDPEDPEAPNECIGTCVGGPEDGDFCTIPEPPDPQACDPATFPRGYYWSFLFGQSGQPLPFINDAIHVPTQDGPVVMANYFDPAGLPQSLQLVRTGECEELEPMFGLPMGGDDMGMGDAGGAAAPYVGVTYTLPFGNLPDGCHRYRLNAVDAEGFTHTYPTYGSLGMEIAGGAIVSNTDACPIWVPDDRPNPGCLPAADECTEGATRVCYTGRAGTQDKGACSAGTETCRSGRWAGICEGEVLPVSTDACGDDVDDNCNGFVDEDCPIITRPGADMGSSSDAGSEDMGAADAAPPGDGGGKGDDGGGCCATIPRTTTNGGLLLFFVAVVAGWRRRRI